MTRRHFGRRFSFQVCDGRLFAFRFERAVGAAQGYRTFRVLLVTDVRVSALRGVRGPLGQTVHPALFRCALCYELPCSFRDSRSGTGVAVPICHGFGIAFVCVQAGCLCSRHLALVRRLYSVDGIERASARGNDRVF